MRCPGLALSALLLFAAIQTAAGADSVAAGTPLPDYLDGLNESGQFRIVFSTDLVTEDMRLADVAPTSPTSEELDALLRHFGLATREGPRNSLLIVSADPENPPSSTLPVESEIPEIMVTSSLHRLEYAHPAAHTFLSRELATNNPAIADEAVRVTHRLPGVSSDGISSRSHVRGGETNETLFLFDGLRLYEPYHLKDFQAVTTIINSNVIDGIDVYTGGYPAKYGDRMSGVTSIDMRSADAPVETEIAVSLFHLSALSLGTFGDSEAGDWLIAGRRGLLDLVADVIEPEAGNPIYQDYVVHVGWSESPRAEFSVNALVSDDRLSLADLSHGEQANATYTNQVFWMRWNAEWSDRLRSRTLLASSGITNRRQGTLQVPGIVNASLNDRREFRSLEFRQDWEWVPSAVWMLRFGVNGRDLHASYDVTTSKAVSAPFDSIPGIISALQIDADLDPKGAQYSAYTELRWSVTKRLIADIGLRWDQQDYTTAQDDRQYSPRASLLIRPDQRSEIRIGWGQYYQAQEINELQIGDGLANFFPAQRAEHFIVSVDHQFPSGIALNASVYRKSFRTLRPRFENLFNALTLLPELQFDRVRVDASGAESVGAEITLTRESENEDTFWWLSYAWSEVIDETAAGDVRRSWDQTHALKGGFSRTWGSWNVSAAVEAHTGWPRTSLAGALVPQPGGGSELVLQAGLRNSVRYSVFHAIDARVSRDFDVRRGVLTAFLELSNLYDRDNPCCDEYFVRSDGTLGSRQTSWLPVVPSLGIVWRF